MNPERGRDALLLPPTQDHVEVLFQGGADGGDGHVLLGAGIGILRWHQHPNPPSLAADDHDRRYHLLIPRGAPLQVLVGEGVLPHRHGFAPRQDSGVLDLVDRRAEDAHRHQGHRDVDQVAAVALAVPSHQPDHGLWEVPPCGLMTRSGPPHEIGQGCTGYKSAEGEADQGDRLTDAQEEQPGSHDRRDDQGGDQPPAQLPGRGPAPADEGDDPHHQEQPAEDGGRGGMKKGRSHDDLLPRDDLRDRGEDGPKKDGKGGHHEEEVVEHEKGLAGDQGLHLTPAPEIPQATEEEGR